MPVDGAAEAGEDVEQEEVTWVVGEPGDVAEVWLPWVPGVDDLALWREQGRGPGLPKRPQG